jgi:hypothetical protein
MAQRQRVMKSTIAGAVLTITVEGAGSVVFDATKASAVNRARAEMHGWNQRLADAAALDKGATAAQKHAAIAELATYYMGGEVEWARKGAAGPRPFDVGLVVTAMCNVLTSGDVDKANRAIEGLAVKRNVTREEAAKLFAADERIAAEMGRIRAQRAGTKFDAQSAIDELLADADEDEETADEPEMSES